MEIVLEEMTAQAIGSTTIIHPPLYKLYVDGIYSGQVPYGDHPTILLFRKFPPSKVEEIEALVREVLGQAWAKAKQPPDPPVKANAEEEEDLEDWE